MMSMRFSRCTVQRPHGDFCDAPGVEDMPFPICAQHAMRLYRRVRDQIEDEASRPEVLAGLLGAELAERADRREQRAASAEHAVYYMLVGDLVKIGHTTQLRSRVRQYPPTSVLLASEAGDGALEKTRHRQFRHLLAAGREWFHPGADLQAHVASLAA